ncbi:ATP-dependent RNA helicase DDX1 [Auxenochlorella protothecoides]|uniref:ATP-dependent RNA helicase DDX1 n=1 Tax=Auxenochlorella protothecoides TaxID=3075 RepID=A0A087SPX9_AUXPR|nr:ATP-dependent RNA helicase DDX1 [Auxenochlorella protothecoides]KFM27783.1 ATP-dependent RNA helicase DDX1 [Auxenochlorella protothecoides]
MSAFEELGVSPELIRAVEELGWTRKPSPSILGGGDIMAAAETGSGKTGAFALPVLQVVQEVRAGLMRTGAPTAGRGAATDPAPAAAVWNAADRDDALAIQPDGLVCQSRSEAAWSGVRASLGADPASGPRYFEVAVCDEGLCRVGWAAPASSLELGTEKGSWGYGGTGRRSHAGAFEPYGRPYGLGDVVGAALDWQARRLSFFLNGKDLGVAYDLPKHLATPLFPAVTLKNAELAANFGAEAWKFPPPPGYQGFLPGGSIGEGLVSWEVASAPAQAGSNAARRPLALILEPTRELAEQTHDNLGLFSKFLPVPGVRTALCLGGTNPKAAERALAEGADIVTGTPGRVMEFVESGKLVLDGIKFFVLDEAGKDLERPCLVPDRLLDTGNQEAIRKLFRRFPKAGAGVARLQVLLFSATLHSEEVRALARELCQDPILVDLRGKNHLPDTVDHLVLEVDPREDRSWLQTSPAVISDGCHTFDATGTDLDTPENWSEAVKRLKPRLLQRCLTALGMEQALIFCRTNHDCDNLEKFFKNLSGGAAAGGGPGNPYSCAVLAGQRSMEERRAALAAFKAGEVRFLVATDVAARGIDIQGLPFVINMTLPERAEDYVHRVGRVGRADALGLAVSLVSALPEKVWYASGKGQRPWLAPSRQNTATNDRPGGQTVWLDEPGLLRDVEERLGAAVPRLPADMALPADIAARLGRGPQAYGGGGADADPAAQEALGRRLAAVQPALAALAKLERDAQASFFDLKRKWAEVEAVRGRMQTVPLGE